MSQTLEAIRKDIDRVKPSTMKVLLDNNIAMIVKSEPKEFSLFASYQLQDQEIQRAGDTGTVRMINWFANRGAKIDFAITDYDNLNFFQRIWAKYRIRCIIKQSALRT